uniref:Uncharacterized protein n=1 Tax=Chromera velia CCMP2878 TaxID=1169474 RepID=A0A0G4GJV5_9ALVE|eukprot:Cvel_22212.t1-p1 / transcript=Cvel_22212.t1 / gene=Cvel_22212 / organism=Chromera_velia_CCMP2878 / gene_product=Lysosomal Pro-X carboxypeptidase, putative / transcript_product=Lysosomal Pro-X carboxypeptidase, putative / location=Cvel_scaffold2159:2889-7655(-) / protein_length=598 / sequence_SO=supercontig / SO=protein_coding / is_pseudo=false
MPCKRALWSFLAVQFTLLLTGRVFGDRLPTRTLSVFRVAERARSTSSPFSHEEQKFTQDNQQEASPKTKWFELPVDHFNANDDRTWKLRFLIDDSKYEPGGSAPMVFYCGNEGDIEVFYNNTGFATHRLRDEFKGLVVFAEHRYFGKSWPFHDQKTSFKMLNLGFLAVEQVLEDFAKLIVHLKKDVMKNPSAPVIALGGSYGGMLSAWFRLKYPGVVTAALAASAPVLQYAGMTGQYEWNKKVTDDFKKRGCADELKTALSDLQSVVSKTSESQKAFLDAVNEGFDLCEKEGVRAKEGTDVQRLIDWLVEGFGELAMVDYPYPATFLGPLSAWPTKALCSAFNGPQDSGRGEEERGGVSGSLRAMLRSSSEASVAGRSKGQQREEGTEEEEDKSPEEMQGNWAKVLEGLRRAGLVGEGECLDDSYSSETDVLGDAGWDYLSCTSQILPIGSNGETDMFPRSDFSLDAVTKECWSKFRTRSDPYWAWRYTGKEWSSCSQVIFSNGDLDPWSTGGFLESPSPDCPSILIADGAHHLDLRDPNDADPPSVVEAREREVELLRGWVEEHVRGGLKTSPEGEEQHEGGRDIGVAGGDQTLEFL